MAVPTDMDGFSDKIGTTDTYSRLSLGDALLNYLGSNINSIECTDIGQFIDKLVPWLTCSNFKVSQKGLEIMTALVERMKSDFKPYVPTVCPAIVDRLGDSHESVRERAQALLMIFLEKEVLTPQQLFDRLNYSFSHKNSKVREEIMVCLVNTINLYGANSIALSKLTPHLVKLLADQNIHVREQAFTTLMEIYRRVGDRLRIDIQRRYASTINPSRLAPLMAKMEELRESGAVMTASEGRYDDETDRPIQRTVVKKLQAKKPPATPLTSTTPVVPGAVDEEFFANAFEEVPNIQIFSAHELKEMVNSIATTVGNPDMDWDKRVEAFKRVRSLLNAGAANYEDFNELIKKWELPFVESLKDLRSHVVRETCVTIAHLAQTLGIKFGRFAEIVFQNLIGLIQSSAKVIASAGFTSIRFIIQNVHNQRLIPIINNNLTSRSREIRKAMCDVLDQLLHTWPLSVLDKRVPLLQEAVRKGVSDADMEARISARRAYWAFKGYFPEQADALLATLDYAYKKNLYGEVSLSGSNQSLNQNTITRQASAPGRSRVPSSATGSAENLHHGFHATHQSLHRTPSLPRNRKSGIPVKAQETECFARPKSADICRDNNLLHNSSQLNYEVVSKLRSSKKRKFVLKIDKMFIENLLRKVSGTKKRRFNKNVYNRGHEEEVYCTAEISKKRKKKKSKTSMGINTSELSFKRPRTFYKSSPSLSRSDKPSKLFSNMVNDEFQSEIDMVCVKSEKSSICSVGDINKILTGFSSLSKEDLAFSHNNLKKSPKAFDNTIKNLEGLSQLYFSSQTTGLRRIDKIKHIGNSQFRCANVKDAETMTVLTGFQEECVSKINLINAFNESEKNTIKKTPKLTNLKYSFSRQCKIDSSSLNISKNSQCSKVKLSEISNDFSNSSKSVTYLFQNKKFFTEEDSLLNLCGKPLGTISLSSFNKIKVIRQGQGEKKMISPGNRSNSAIDLHAVQRANARAQYAAMNRLKAGSGASLPRSRKSPEVTTVPSPERSSRPRSRVSGYSQSQPTSRSTSPSSHLNYHTYQSPTSRARKLSGGGISGIPGPRSSTNSRETSRETSPTRLGSLSKLRSRALTHMSSLDRPPSSARPVMTQKILQQSREAESALADALNFDDGHSDMVRSLSSKKPSKLFDDHSDESETSSVCSERSFDSLRRPSDSYSWSGSQSRIYKDFWNDSSCRDISEIIANCSRSSWSERKEGLVGLNQYLQNGNLLTPSELKRVTEIFTKMFMDSQTKVFTLFLDTLNEIIIKHQADLNDWLYILMTKLLNKLGSDVLTSIGRKIHNTLTLVRENFSTELQMNEILRFIIDPTQTHNTKVKVAALNYLAQLASEMEPSDFNPSNWGGKDPTAAALAKMINWTKNTDTKGTGEVKRAAQEAIIALFNLNTSVITMKLAELSKEHQELAANLVHNHLRHSSGGSGGVSVPSSPAPMPSSPSRPSLLSLKNNHVDTDSMDSDEIYKSLRRTTAEIQNYSFESKLVERDRDTTSQDSGISQMSAGPGDKMEALEERIEAMTIQGSNSGHSSSLSSPTQRAKEYNGMEKTLTTDSLDEQDGYQENPEEEAEAWKNVLQTLSGVNNEPLTSQQKEALTLLFRLVRQGSTLTLTQNFRKLFKILVQLLPLIDSSQPSKVISDVAVITQVLRTITEMFKKPALTPLFADFTELLLMKVMRLFEGAHKDNKEVVRHAETCCSAMATVLSVDTTLKMLNAFAHTKEHPANMYAVKTITKVVQHRNKELIYPHLKQTMTALIEAYNSEHSSVRKSVVFCIVALHAVFGEEELAPYLDKLCPSKRKLLNLYIKRQQHGTSTPPNESKNNSDKDFAPPI